MQYLNPAEIKIIITALAGSFGLTTVNGDLWQLIDTQKHFTIANEELTP
jgi:hypothetical protein